MVIPVSIVKLDAIGLIQHKPTYCLPILIRGRRSTACDTTMNVTLSSLVELENSENEMNHDYLLWRRRMRVE